jgi:hypothetical protein
MQWLVLVLKIGCISGFCSLTGWVIQYTYYTRWWKTKIGPTLTTKTMLVAGLLLPTTISLFAPLPPMVIGWLDASIICAITPVMIWRMIIWHLTRSEPDPLRELAARVAGLEEENARLRAALSEGGTLCVS